MSAEKNLSFVYAILLATIGVGAAFIAVFPMGLNFAGDGTLSSLGSNIFAAILTCSGAGFALGVVLEILLRRNSGSE